MSTRQERIVPVYTDRAHRAGGFLLILGGIIGTITGLVTLMYAASRPSLFGFTSVTVAVVGGIVLVFSIIEFAGGWSAYRARNWYGSLTAGVLGIVTGVSMPLAIIGTLLIALSEGQFDRHEEMEVEATEAA